MGVSFGYRRGYEHAQEDLEPMLRKVRERLSLAQKTVCEEADYYRSNGIRSTPIIQAVLTLSMALTELDALLGSEEG